MSKKSSITDTKGRPQTETEDHMIQAISDGLASKKSRPPDNDDDESFIGRIYKMLLENKIILNGYTANEPDAELPAVKKVPFTNNYEIRINASAERKLKDFIIAALVMIAQTKEPDFLAQSYNGCSSMEELITKLDDVLMNIDRIITLL